jgi:hypothetical protein
MYALKYDAHEAYVDWDDRGGPMCSGYPFEVELARARTYSSREQAKRMEFPGVHVVMLKIQEVG